MNDDFYEDDEPVVEVQAAFERGPHNMTGRARRRVVSFRVTDQEYAALERLAERLGVTVSALARRSALLPAGGRRPGGFAPPFFAFPTTTTTTVAAPVTITWKAA